MTTPTLTLPNIGLEPNQIEEAAVLLNTLLADEYLLRTKLRKYHWNVTGPQFHALHEMFEEQYEEMAEVIDDIAERARTYGFPAIGTLSEFAQRSRLEETPGNYPDAHAMVVNLVNDHESLVRFLREDLQTAGGNTINDAGLEDFFTGILQRHQEMAWMLRSFLMDERTT